MSFSCVKHPMTVGEHICGECGHQFCPECVVFPFGTAKPPLCIACALERGGVRRQASNRPKLSRRSIRQRLSLQRDVAAQPVPPPVPDGFDPPPPAPVEPVWLGEADEAEELPGGWSESYH
jgi:hypothetical protein